MEYVEKFQEFFEKFDLVKEEMGILSYGVQNTTLEDVFLKIGQIEEAKLKPDLNQTNDREINNHTPSVL